MNLSVLHTLPDTEFACGMGEVLKSGLIWDADYYRWLLRIKKRHWRWGAVLVLSKNDPALL